MKLRKTHTLRWLVIGGLGFILLSSSGSQCSKTSEQVMGPTLDTQNVKDPCETDCWNKFVVARYGELKRWRNEVKLCLDDQVCIQRANELHAAILAELEADHAACVAACGHEQGGGTGGQ